MSNQPVPYPLRMPDELRDQLTENARIHGRSLNAEILGILQEAVSERRQPIAALDVDALADALAERLAVRLKST